ncbi:MAG: ThiF family adenylyltransferase [Lachnospiraceae bacterium]
MAQEQIMDTDSPGPFSRTELLLGEGAMKRLKKARVIVFGIGGVGGHAVEALVRSGVGGLDLVDHDRVSLTNLNRQIVALHSTVGRLKVEVMAERAKDINPDIRINVYPCFYLPETAAQFDFSQYDYVIDCIDTVAGKLQLIEAAKTAGVPVISSMGAGNKLDPTQFKVADITKTSVCPLAKVMRRELKKRGIKEVKVVFSTEEVAVQLGQLREDKGVRRTLPGSTAFVPSVAGLIIASEVIKDIAGEKQESI